MPTRKLPGFSMLAGMIAVSLWAWVPAALSGSPSPVADQARYVPTQSISHDFGAKTLSGYFEPQGVTCIVVLMIGDKIDPEATLPPSPTRVRLALTPGQVAGLDSAEGRSLNLTCGPGAASLVVDSGERGDLVARQERALHERVAQSP